jgi:dephospho-CoA kinase
LGNEEEDYLIIPDLKKSPKHWLSRRVIGFSGPIAAGKTTAATALQKQGFGYGRFSQVLALLLQESGKPVNRDTLQELGERVHRSPGQRWLCRRLVAALPERGNLAIDGLRWPEDHATLVEAHGPSFQHVYITASTENRRVRYVKDGHSKRDFESAIQHPVERKIADLATLAHFRVSNDGTRKGFTSKVKQAIMQHKSHTEG